MRILILFLAIILFNCAHAQQLSYDARGMALGGAGVAFTGAPSLFANPAGLASVESTEFLVGASSRFELSELTTVWMGAALPVNNGVFGLRLEAFGFDTWKQQRAAFSYARPLFDRLKAAVSFSYLQNSIEGYGRNGKLSGGFGLQAGLLSNLVLGIQVDNPIPISYAEGDYLPTVFRAGVSWQNSERLLLAAQLDKTLDYLLRLRAGIEYQPFGEFRFRFGFATEPAEYSGGLALPLSSQLSLELATTYHQVLGFTPALLVRYATLK